MYFAHNAASLAVYLLNNPLYQRIPPNICIRPRKTGLGGRQVRIHVQAGCGGRSGCWFSCHLTNTLNKPCYPPKPSRIKRVSGLPPSLLIFSHNGACQAVNYWFKPHGSPGSTDVKQAEMRLKIELSTRIVTDQESIWPPSSSRCGVRILLEV
jgi:hypothetical protein